MTESTAYTPPVIDHTEWDETGDRILLFSISRKIDDVETSVDYTMPARPHVGLALAYLKMSRKQGNAVASMWLLEQAAGEEAYDALAAEPDLNPETVNQIISKVSRVVLGGLSGPKAS